MPVVTKIFNFINARTLHKWESDQLLQGIDQVLNLFDKLLENIRLFCVK